VKKGFAKCFERKVRRSIDDLKIKTAVQYIKKKPFYYNVEKNSINHCLGGLKMISFTKSFFPSKKNNHQ